MERRLVTARRFAASLAAGLAAILAVAAAPGMAQDRAQDGEKAAAPPTDQQLAEGLFRSTARLTAPKKRDPACGDKDARGEIVVCGADRGARWRVPSTTETDPSARESRNTGIARAPDVSALPDCSRGCIHLGKKVPQVLTIDLSKLPRAPAGSDADRIAKGEMADR